jgi:predicted nuclease of restriction endonuclease-like RecB superfamily
MTIRQQNRLRRNERIRQAFQQRYTDVPRPRKFSREYVLSKLADEFCLSVATIEDIIYAKSISIPEAPTAPEVSKPLAA